MKNKLLLIISGICILLSSCNLNTKEQNTDIASNNSNETKEIMELTLHDRVMLSNDKELIKQYKTLQSYVLKGDYKKAFSLVMDKKNKLDAIYETSMLVFSEKDIKKDPSDYKAYNDRGVYKYEFNDIKGALKDFNKALEINPYYYLAYQNKADIEKKDKNYDAAEKDYDLAFKYNPYDTYPLIKKGKMFYQNNSYDKAVEAFTKAIELENEPYNIIYRGLSYYKLNNKEKFLEDAETAAKMFKKDNDKSYEIVQSLQNDISEKVIKVAEDKFYLSATNKLFSLFPDTKIPSYDDIAIAKKYYETLFNPKATDETIIKYQKAYKDLIKGNYEEAKKIFNCNFFEAKSQDYGVHKEICEHYSFYLHSLELRSETIKKKPERAQFYDLNDLGEKKAKIYDKKGAIQALNKAIKLNPYYSEAYYYRALIKVDNKDYDGAIKDIDLAIKYDPYNEELYSNGVKILYNMYVEQHSKNPSDYVFLDKASEYVNKAISLVPNTTNLMTRAFFNTLYDITEKKLQQARSDILLVLERAQKTNNKKDIEMANIILKKVIEHEDKYANALLPMSIYRQAYYSIDKIKEFCKGRNISSYLKLAEETYSILNYNDIEIKMPAEAIEHASKVASDQFDKDYESFNDNKPFICAFIETSPYDTVVDSGIKLIELVDKYADKTEYKDNYKKFKNTIISYIPKMMVNNEQKKKIMKQIKEIK